MTGDEPRAPEVIAPHNTKTGWLIEACLVGFVPVVSIAIALGAIYLLVRFVKWAWAS